jgi:putative peptide zinc metalloprotease protein
MSHAHADTGHATLPAIPKREQGRASKRGTVTEPGPGRRPRRAPGVELLGELRDGAFESTQWLIQRDGRFVQVPELLYRLLEQADGRRDLEAIAAAMTQSTSWTVSPENVRELIETKLVPAGLINAQDGSHPVRREEPRFRSPLAVAWRRVVLGPDHLRPVVESLRLLFSPALLAPVLAAIVLVHAWLYLEHGFNGAIREVTLQPAFILASGLVFVTTAAFHELGHAAALRYGGGKARGIGVGFYLVYPVFFTDTTDAYRLGRWDRVRVDLGGFYFQLMAAVWVTGLAVGLGQEWLLFPVLLINLEAIRQLLFPFVRLDGYWLFADLTGIPDLFSNFKPFLRRVLPRIFRNGAKLPALRPGATAAVGVYFFVAVPLLGFLLYQAFAQAPEVMTTAWGSLNQQAAGFDQAFDSGDVVSALGSFAEVLILAAPALATIVFFTILVVWGASLLRRR